MAMVIDGKGLLSWNQSIAKNPKESVLDPRFYRCSSHIAVKSKISISRLRIYTCRGKFNTVSSLNAKNFEEESYSSKKEASFDIKLPRRSLMVQFTCNACGERTQRTVNRLAYERGTVFVQCAGCLVHHKLVDNLGLVVEYNLQEIDSENGDAEQH